MRIIITLLLFTLCLQLTVAQNSNLRFRHINIENGLSSNTALSVAQDKDGFMWFGTIDGLNKYDGYTITTYRYDPQDSLSLSSSRVNDILIAEDGNLWIGTANGLNYYLKDKNQFIKFDPPEFEIYNVLHLTKDSKDRLWVGTAEGLFQFDTKERVFVPSRTIPNNPYSFLERNISNITEDKNGVLWLCTTEGLYIVENEVISKASVKGKHPVFSSIELFRDVLVDTNGDYWIASESLENGVFRFDSELNFIRSYSSIEGQKETLAGNKVRVLSQFSDGRIWLGTYSGLSVFEPSDETFRNYQANKYNLNSLSHNSVQDIFEDWDGGIWIATYSGGINYFHPSFQKFSHVMEIWLENSLSNNQVWGFAQDNKGNIWIGTEDGLNFLDTSKNFFTHFYREQSGKGLLDNTIKTLAFDKNNNLWIGGLLGLSYFDYSKKKFKHFVHDPLDVNSIGYGQVLTVCEDRKGQIWIGTNSGGLNKYNSEDNTFDRFEQIEHEPGEMVDLRTSIIIEYENEFLWIGTERGLELFNTETGFFTRSKLKGDGVFNSISEVNILTLYMDGEKNLWIGTNGSGLLIYNTKGGEIYRIDSHLGLPNNTVNGILEDNSGNFWVSTNRGISKLNKPVDGWNTFNQTHIVNFNVSEGLQGSQFYPNSAFKSKDGQLYFGGTNGYNSFKPDNVQKTNVQPEVVFTDIRFRNDIKKHRAKTGSGVVNFPEDSITISYSQSDFSIEFAALNYFDPEHTVYAYKMEPVDQEWIPIENERLVNYSKLPQGEYIFKVKATNNVLNWGENFSQISIIVLPPYWRSWWAYLLYFLALMVLLFLFFINASKWGKLRSDLAWQHLEREKEQELHQLRIKFFTDISHELRTPLTLILAPLERLTQRFMGSPKLKNQLLAIQRNGERMLQLINQLLDLRKLETGHLNLKAGKGDIVKFLNEVSLAFREVALQKNIIYTVHSGIDEIDVWFDRDKFEIILYNLISNAIKYTPEGGRIGLSLEAVVHPEDNELQTENIFTEGYVEINVEDNGIGIPSKNLDKIFNRFYQSEQKSHESAYGSGVGLEIVKSFVDLHKGTITVHSLESIAGQPGKTRFTIKLAIGRKHLNDSEIIENFSTSEDISLYKHSTQEADSESLTSETMNSSSEEDSSEQGEKSTILVVEDNDEVRKFIISLFESTYLVLEAENGKQGLEHAFEKIPDLVISDIMMPEMDGMELCKQIKSDQRTSHIPVILLTARTAVTFQIEGMETGADDYITKPFSTSVLKMRVRKLIEQRQDLRKLFSKGPGLIPEEISITSVDEKLMKKAIDFINDHISDNDLTVEKVAEEVSMSRVHFYRKIKALTNLSAIEFIRLIRLERAAQLLKTGKLNVSEVRYAIGMQDAEYFRKTFKQHFKQTPSDYAKGEDPSIGTDKPAL